VRIPETFEGDCGTVALHGRSAAALFACQHLRRHHLTAIFAELLDRSEAMTDACAQFEGTYRAVDFLDNDASISIVAFASRSRLRSATAP